LGAIIDLDVVEKTLKTNADESPHINRNHDEQPPPPEISHAAKTVNKARLLRMKKSDPFVSNFTQNLFKSKRESDLYELTHSQVIHDQPADFS
jgi:hypothetical protein